MLVADPPATRLCGEACLRHLHRGAARGARAATCQQGTEHEGDVLMGGRKGRETDG